MPPFLNGNRHTHGNFLEMFVILFKIIINSCISVGMTVSEAVSRFNSNVSYSGLLHAVTGDVSKLDKHCKFKKASRDTPKYLLNIRGP